MTPPFATPPLPQLCSFLIDSRTAMTISFETATTDSLRRVMTMGATVLHYSGHGEEAFLAFEGARLSYSLLVDSQAWSAHSLLSLALSRERRSEGVSSLSYLSTASLDISILSPLSSSLQLSIYSPPHSLCLLSSRLILRSTRLSECLPVVQTASVGRIR